MTANTLVVDANVFVAMFSGEADGPRWAAAIAGRELRAPRIARFESATAFSRKVRRGAISSSQALAALNFIDGLDVAWDELDDATIDRALLLSFAVGHEVADCVYLAMAQAAKAPLATADAKLAAIAARQGVAILTLSPA